MCPSRLFFSSNGCRCECSGSMLCLVLFLFLFFFLIPLLFGPQFGIQYRFLKRLGCIAGIDTTEFFFLLSFLFIIFAYFITVCNIINMPWRYSNSFST